MYFCVIKGITISGSRNATKNGYELERVKNLGNCVRTVFFNLKWEGKKHIHLESPVNAPLKKPDAFLGLNRVCIIIEFSEITGPRILMKN